MAKSIDKKDKNHQVLIDNIKEIRNSLRVTIANTNRIYQASKLLADIKANKLYEAAYSDYDHFIIDAININPIDAAYISEIHQHLSPEQCSIFTLAELMFLVKIEDKALMKQVVESMVKQGYQQVRRENV